MRQKSAPPNARGICASSPFWGLGPTDQERFRAGWWDAYDRKRTSELERHEAYRLGRAEYEDHVAPHGAGRKQAMKLIDRPLKDLRDHPRNARERTPETVAAMRAMIERQGLQQPLLTHADGTTLAGHRRRWALEDMGETKAPCIVVDGDEALQLEILVSSNEGVERIDPMAEAENIAAMLALPGWTHSTVAAALGKTRAWVSARVALQGLIPALRKRYTNKDDRFSSWPLEWLGQVAALSPATQEAMNESRWTLEGIEDLEGLRDTVAEETHELSLAPWKLDDAHLVPRAGACTLCPKTSARSPGLFEEEIEDQDAAKARCLDKPCWAKKENAHVAQQLAVAQEENEDLVVVDARGYAAAPLKALEKINTTSADRVKVVKGTAKGAVPAAILKQDGSVERTFVSRDMSTPGRKPSGDSTTATPAAEKTPAQKLKDSRAGIAKRRSAHMIDAVVDAISDERLTPSMESVRKLLVRYPLSPGVVFDKEGIEEIAADDLRFARDLWQRLRGAIAADLGNRYGPSDITPKLERAEWIAPMVDLSVDELEVQAREDIPDPKWWPVASPSKEGSKKPKVKKAAGGAWGGLTGEQRLARVNAIRKGKGLPPKTLTDLAFGAAPEAGPKSSEPEVCQKCGCTEANPCVYGPKEEAGWWIDAERAEWIACFTDRHGSERAKPRGKAAAAGDDDVVSDAPAPAKKRKAKKASK